MTPVLSQIQILSLLRSPTSTLPKTWEMYYLQRWWEKTRLKELFEPLTSPQIPISACVLSGIGDHFSLSLFTFTFPLTSAFHFHFFTLHFHC